MRAEQVVEPVMFPFVEKVKVHLARAGQKMIGILGNEGAAVRKMFFDLIIEMFFLPRETHLEQSFRSSLLHRKSLFLRPDQDGFRLRVVNPDDDAGFFRVHTEHGMGVGSGAGKQGGQCRTERIRRCFFHGSQIRSVQRRRPKIRSR